MRPLLCWLISPILCAAQVVLTTPPPPETTVSSPVPGPTSSIPSPRDLPIPDLNSIPKPAPKHDSALKRHLKAALPRCLWIGLRFCWSQPEQTPTPNQFYKDVDIADFYFFERKNYRGAESRYREALDLLPGDPEVTFKLAVSLDRLHRTDEARTLYQSYLATYPNGDFAVNARAALKRINP
jgi:hypothetical protein